jgi:hypothetical protein
MARRTHDGSPLLEAGEALAHLRHPFSHDVDGLLRLGLLTPPTSRPNRLRDHLWAVAQPLYLGLVAVLREGLDGREGREGREWETWASLRPQAGRAREVEECHGKHLILLEWCS